jgi:cytochrome c oxidase cbb3-type subunit 4
MIGTVRGLSTLVLLAMFLGLIVWAFGRRRRAAFEAMARIVFEDEPTEPRRSPPEQP